jgi:hypothetical protein
MHRDDEVRLVFNRSLRCEGENSTKDCRVGAKSVDGVATTGRQRGTKSAERTAAAEEQGKLQVFQHLAREVKNPETIKMVSVEFMAQVCGFSLMIYDLEVRDSPCVSPQQLEPCMRACHQAPQAGNLQAG